MRWRIVVVTRFNDTACGSPLGEIRKRTVHKMTRLSSCLTRVQIVAPLRVCLWFHHIIHRVTRRLRKKLKGTLVEPIAVTFVRLPETLSKEIDGQRDQERWGPASYYNNGPTFSIRGASSERWARSLAGVVVVLDRHHHQKNVWLTPLSLFLSDVLGVPILNYRGVVKHVTPFRFLLKNENAVSSCADCSGVPF